MCLTIAEEPGLILEQGEKPLTPEREEELRIPEQGEELLILEREEAVSWIVDDSRIGEFLQKVPGGLSRKQEYE